MSLMERRIQIAAKHFGIEEPEDWANILPTQVLEVEECGPKTLDALRIYLAMRGLTLRNDETPLHWQETLGSTRIGAQVSKSDKAVTLPFTILIDTAEQQPFAFQGFNADADQDYRPLSVRTEPKYLGPSHGDYAIKGYEGWCHVERKGPGDAIGTFLSQGERHDRWERTLEFLAEIPCAAVVIECSFGKMLSLVESRGKRSKSVLQKTLHCQVLAWEQDWRVPFIFCDSRRFAELTTLQILKRFYRHQKQEQTEEERKVDDMLSEIL